MLTAAWRRAAWPALALAGDALGLLAFLRLPWADGNGALAGRHFTGRELAALARTADIVLTGVLGRPLAVALAAALYAVPATAVAGLLLLAGAPWTSNPPAAARAAAVAGLLTAAIGLLTTALIALGPGAGDVLHRSPGPGVLGTIAGGALAFLGAVRAARLLAR